MDPISDAIQYIQQPTKRAREERTRPIAHDMKAVPRAKRRKNKTQPCEISDIRNDLKNHLLQGHIEPATKSTGYEASDSTASGRAGRKNMVEEAERTNENVEFTSEQMFAYNEPGVFRPSEPRSTCLIEKAILEKRYGGFRLFEHVRMKRSLSINKGAGGDP
jgi:hypothetical protein